MNPPWFRALVHLSLVRFAAVLLPDGESHSLLPPLRSPRSSLFLLPLSTFLLPEPSLALCLPIFFFRFSPSVFISFNHFLFSRSPYLALSSSSSSSSTSCSCCISSTSSSASSVVSSSSSSSSSLVHSFPAPTPACCFLLVYAIMPRLSSSISLTLFYSPSGGGFDQCAAA